MNNSMFQCFLIFAAIMIAPSAIFSKVGMAENEQNRYPSAREIPGLTIEDKFPDGCVDCHINMPERKQDERISTLMSGWTIKIDEKLLNKVRKVFPNTELKGVHPLAAESLEDIPSACIACHRSTSDTAPPFAELLHVIHLTGLNENHFLTIFQGECTHCHKLNAETGAWTMPSGPEK